MKTIYFIMNYFIQLSCMLLGWNTVNEFYLNQLRLNQRIDQTDNFNMFSWLISPWKDVNSLPEIKLQDNEEIIFSNYKINALDERHTTWNQKLAFYYCTLTNKAFYFLILRKLHPEVKFFARTTTTIKTQNFDEKVWKRISYEQLEIKFGKIFFYKYVQLIDKEDKFYVTIQLTALFNKQAKQIEKYINDELKHLVIKS